MAGELRIDLLGPQDWREYKALRLEALRREPNAFNSTHAEALTRADAWWQARLANPRSLMLMARRDGQPVGNVGLHLGTDDGDARVATVNGMYVTASERRQGVGRGLLLALLDQLAAHPEVVTIRLWVRANEAPARRLYEALGFRIAPRPGQPGSRERPDNGQLIMERPVHWGERLPL